MEQLAKNMLITVIGIVFALSAFVIITAIKPNSVFGDVFVQIIKPAMASTATELSCGSLAGAQTSTYDQLVPALDDEVSSTSDAEFAVIRTFMPKNSMQSLNTSGGQQALLAAPVQCEIV